MKVEMNFKDKVTEPRRLGKQRQMRLIAWDRKMQIMNETKKLKCTKIHIN